MINPDYEWITEADELRQLIKKAIQDKVVFLDTEFHRETTFFPILALIQVSIANRNYLIEPSLVEQVPEFCHLLSNDSTRVVMHSASEDCEVLYRRYGVKINELFDTQIACGFLYGQSLGNNPLGLGFAGMVDKLLGVAVNKDQSRSDWLARPLSTNQEIYAVADVHYLALCYQCLLTELGKKSAVKEWILQDSCAVSERVNTLDDTRYAYLDFKNAYAFDDLQLTRLSLLAQWREQVAREKNKPKNFILRNEILLALAQRGLQDNSLPYVDNWHPASRRRYGQEVGQLLSSVVQAELFEYRPLSPKYWQKRTGLVRAVSSNIDEISTKLGAPSEALTSRKLLRQYIAFTLGDAPTLPANWTKIREETLSAMISSHLS